MICDFCFENGRERKGEQVISFVHRNGHYTWVTFCGEHEKQAVKRVEYYRKKRKR